MLSHRQQTAAAASFAKRWADRGYEKGETGQFWIELLRSVFGLADAEARLVFEQHVPTLGFIDARIPSTRILIEQKSAGKDLRAAAKQSDGAMLTPFQQAKRYADWLPFSERPRWIVVCNFKEFLVYDMEQPQAAPEQILLGNLGKEFHRLAFLVKTEADHLGRELEVSMRAGEIIGEIYDALLYQYALGTDQGAPAQPRHRDLNILCVRLVFCLYCEDAGIFRKDQFHDYLHAQDTPHFRRALLDLFAVLNTPVAERDAYLEPDLAAFPYVNGGLFREPIAVPQFTPALRQLILKNAALDFDWSEISPTIFGALFESTLNPETRRSGGMHYTSPANIHRVIDPLFLDDLRAELGTLLQEKVERRRQRALDAFQERLSRLTFLDPACGSGNFLTETYLSLRRLENDVIRERHRGQAFLPGMNPVRVSIAQFHGIEVNDFAVTVAVTAMWISEAQMLAETERITGHDIDFLPLKNYTHIIEGNALTTPWPVAGYIFGNPPFIGARIMSTQQKADMQELFGARWKNLGNMDYVCAWYKRAWDAIRGTAARAAFVSTNSITQGEQPALLFGPLMREGLRIDFAWRTFRWDSEATQKAHVHCVIVGFSDENTGERTIYDGGKAVPARHINAYLMDAPDVFITSRPKPLCDVPEIGIGNKPIDGGNYLFTDEEKQAFLRREPKAEAYFRPWYGAQEFLHRQPRWCLWLGDCTPAALRAMPLCYRRVQAVREFRLQSKSAGTRKLADTPTRFHVENMPDGNYLLVPRVSSERREYVPIGFMQPEALSSDSVHIIPHATLAHFAVLTSSVHMAWMRAVCGRLETRYRYSKDIVYNNFPWPAHPVIPALPSSRHSDADGLEQTARAILDARALYPDSTLADLYDPLTMPPELRRAHEANDRAVLRLYSLPENATEEQTVAHLFRLYAGLTAREA